MRLAPAISIDCQYVDARLLADLAAGAERTAWDWFTFGKEARYGPTGD